MSLACPGNHDEIMNSSAETKQRLVKTLAVPAKSPVAAFAIDIKTMVCTLDAQTELRLDRCKIWIEADTCIGW